MEEDMPLPHEQPRPDMTIDPKNPQDATELHAVREKLAQIKQDPSIIDSGEASQAQNNAQANNNTHESGRAGNLPAFPEPKMSQQQKDALLAFLNKQPQTEEERAVAEAVRFLQQERGAETERSPQVPTEYTDAFGQMRKASKQFVGEAEQGIFNQGTLLAFLEANRNYGLVSFQSTDNLMSEGPGQKFLKRAQRCQEVLEGSGQERAIYCSEQSVVNQEHVQKLLSKTDEDYRKARRFALSSGHDEDYMEEIKGVPMNESEDEWIARHRSSDRHKAAISLRYADILSKWAQKCLTEPALPYRKETNESQKMYREQMDEWQGQNQNGI